MTNLFRRAVAALALTTLALGSVGNAGAVPPTFEAIGPIDFEVTGMSGDGTVLVGKFILGGPAFRWTRAGGTEFIGGTGDTVKVSTDGSAIAGNVIVDGHNEAALWLGHENWLPLGGLGTTGCPDFSNGFNISGDGQVIVGLGWDGCQARGFRWDQANGMVDLGTLVAGTASRANAVNYDGSVIVGWDDAFDGSRRGARWVNGVESLLIDEPVFNPDVYLGEALAVTPDGMTIVGGEAGPIEGPIYDQAYIWTPANGAKLIGKLPGGGSFFRTFGTALSDDGALVGGFSGTQARKAFLWSDSTGMINFLDYLLALDVQGLDGWTVDVIRGISGDGTKLSGWGINPDGFVQSWLVENLPRLGDADGDEVFDALDNCALVANPDQRDTNGDGYGNLCDADLNNDCIVNALDLGLFKAVFFSSDPDADLNGDGAVNTVDLGLFRTLIFQPPGPGANGVCNTP